MDQAEERMYFSEVRGISHKEMAPREEICVIGPRKGPIGKMC